MGAWGLEGVGYVVTAVGGLGWGGGVEGGVADPVGRVDVENLDLWGGWGRRGGSGGWGG